MLAGGRDVGCTETYRGALVRLWVSRGMVSWLLQQVMVS